MKLKNTLGLAICQLQQATHDHDPALVQYMQSRLIVSGWLVWSGGFDYKRRHHREMILPNRNQVNKALEHHYENQTSNSIANS
jgi:hypothetical protein